MPAVSDLKISPLPDTDGEYYATWSFTTSAGSANAATNTSIQVGSLVKVNSGATWYNGVAISDFVFEENWYVYSLSGDRAVLNSNESYTNEIMSPISTSNLTLVGASSDSSTTTAQDTSHLSKFEVKWYNDFGVAQWFDASSEDVEAGSQYNSTYSPPDNSIALMVTVTPVSETYTVDDEEVSYWTGTQQYATYYNAKNEAPDDISSPTVTIEEYTLTAVVDNISDVKADKVEFEVLSGSSSTSSDRSVFASGVVDVKSARATYTCSVNAGYYYAVRCRAINVASYDDSTNGTNGAYVYGEWSDYSSDAGTKPSAPDSISDLRATSSTSVHIEWSKVASATSYDIEYATKKSYFDASSEVTSISNGSTETHYEVTGLETGSEYFFRVRATNDQGESGWTDIKSVIVGKKPSAPTTWSSTTTAISGTDVILYWVHNAQDNSRESYAKLGITIGSGTESITTISKTYESDEDEETTSSYTVSTTSYTEGTVIKWRVCTAGVTNEYGDWSVQRQINVYAPATLSSRITNSAGSSLSKITSFPFYLKCTPGPSTQSPIGYHVTVTANSSYQTVDNVGETKYVTKDEEIYSKYFDTSNALTLEFSPSSIDLQNGVSYTVTTVVAMNSGLTATSTNTFTVTWTDAIYDPDASIGIDKTNWSAYIRPYCNDKNGNAVTNITMGVYRRNFDGEFIEIKSGIEGGSLAYITDPHPALDYARYRIVVQSNSTGAISYTDIPNYPVHCTSALVQWNDTWSDFTTSETNRMMNSPATAAVLEIAYNLKVSDTSQVDSELVEYIGRDHPVAYYGTQLGQSSSWSFEFPMSDTDTLTRLRRLERWTGDCYVREPHGTGYWANVQPKYNINYNTTIISATLTIKRVEGGI